MLVTHFFIKICAKSAFYAFYVLTLIQKFCVDGMALRRSTHKNHNLCTMLRLFLSFLICFWVNNTWAQTASGVRFIRNQGQWKKDIRYRADIPGGYLLLKEKSLRYVFIDVEAIKNRHTNSPTENPSARLSEAINGHVVEVFFDGSNATNSITENHQNEVLYNYFLGNDTAHWAKNVPSFGEIIYQNIYPNIDLKLYAFRQTVKYEFIVKPNADAAQIKMRYEGSNSIKVFQNQLHIETSVNSFREVKPYTYQEVDNRTIEIPTQFKLIDNVVSFDFQQTYNHQHDLVIDPELVFSTYSGALSDNWGHTATYDEQGNLYSAGTVHDYSASPITTRPFNVTTGAFQTRFGGQVDIGILKFNPDGSKLLWATYLGGAFTETPHSLIVNSKGELVIMGSTSSPNFPITTSAFQRQFGGGVAITPIDGLDMDNGSDVFVAKLNASGSSLLASTFVGGAGNDGICRVSDFAIQNYGDEFRGEVAIDDKDNVYVATSTASANFPLVKSIQNTIGGRQDAVVFKMDGELRNLLFSSYLGGAGTDAAYGIKWATSGAFYVSGTTRSVNLPVKNNTFKSTLGGNEDGFIAKFSNDQLEQISYLGTTSDDAGYLVDIDTDENVYVYGCTTGTYPVSVGVYSNSKGGQFIQSLDKTLSKSIFSTVFGGSRGTPDISPTALLVNDCGNIYLSGWGGFVNTRKPHNVASSTNGLPVTADGFQRTTNGSNFWIGIFEKGAKSLLYATYFGSLASVTTTSNRGDHVDGGTSRFSKNGIIYQATCACGGSNFPTSPNAWSKTNNSVNCNNAAFKFDIDKLRAAFDVYDGTKRDVVTGCAPLTLDFINASEGGKTYIWDVAGNVISRDAVQSKYTFTQPGEYKVTLKIFNPLVCKGQDVATRIIKVGESKAKAFGDTVVCTDAPVMLRATGGYKYVWTPSAGLSNANIANPIAKVKNTTQFTVQVTDSFCVASRNVTVTINNSKPDFQAFKDTTICPGQSAQLSVKGAALGVRWTGVNSTDSTKSIITVKPLVTTTYTVQGRYVDGCLPSKSVTVKVEDNKPDFKAPRDTTICEGQLVRLQAQGNAQSYKWTPSVSDSTAKSPVVQPLQTTTYTVTGNYADGCQPRRSVTITVERGPQGVNFDFNPTYNCGEPTKIELINKTPTAVRYEWNLGNGTTANIATPSTYSYSQNGNYQVILRAFSAKGCESSITKTINLLNLNSVPNIITPNGDGKNDTFKIGILNTKIEIVNRWGRQVFVSDNYADDWGNGVTNGTYFYSMVLPSGQQCKGWVEVLQ